MRLFTNQKELKEFLQKSTYSEILELAIYDAFSIMPGQFTIVGGKVFFHNGEKVEGLGNLSDYNKEVEMEKLERLRMGDYGTYNK